MSEPVFERLKEGLAEVIEIQTGAKPAARIHINGHAYVPEQQWQPIETAPVDGTEVLGWNPIREEIRVMWFFNDDFGSKGFISGWDHENPDWMFPAMWMPLPNPPQS